MIFPQNTLPNHLHIEGFRIFNKKEFGRRFQNLQSNLHANKTRSICDTYQLTHPQFHPKKGGGDKIGYDGFKKITGTKIHVVVESN